MVWEIAWKLKHKTVCFVFFIVVFYLQKIFKKSANSVKKQSRFCYGSLNKIPLPIKRLREHCFVKLEFFLPIFLCTFMNSHMFFLRKLIRILPKCWPCAVFFGVSEKAAIPKRKKNFKLSQLVDIVVVCLSYFFCYFVPNSLYFNP